MLTNSFLWLFVGCPPKKDYVSSSLGKQDILQLTQPWEKSF